jgi:hypothetical protein
MLGSNLIQDNSFPALCFTWFFSVPAGKCSVEVWSLPSKSFQFFQLSHHATLYSLDTDTTVKEIQLNESYTA